MKLEGWEIDLNFMRSLRTEPTRELVRRRDYEGIEWRHRAVTREIARRGRSRLPHVLSLATTLRATRRAGR